MTSATELKAAALTEQIRQFDLKAPASVLFGIDKVEELGNQCRQFVERRDTAFVIYGGRSASESDLDDRIAGVLQKRGIRHEAHYGIDREPTAWMVDDATTIARRHDPKIIIGVGGGSVIDAAKAVAALLTNEGSVEDYLEGVGIGRTLKRDPLPMIAVPTTAGTGAEATKNSVVSAPTPERKYKKSMRDERMIPNVAIIDPGLTMGLPAHQVAAGGMDAITQLIEPCISTKRTPVTTELALEVLPYPKLALAAAYEDSENLGAREEMALASFTSGVCLANSGLALAHGIASGLGALQNVPHGLICGVLLPHTLRFNRDACKGELAEALAAFLGVKSAGESTIDDGIQAIASLNEWLQLPPDLKFLNLENEDLRRISHASMGSSMSGNPVPMTPDSTYEFLKSIA